jgi:hypothetical protein
VYQRIIFWMIFEVGERFFARLFIPFQHRQYIYYKSDYVRMSNAHTEAERCGSGRYCFLSGTK